MQIEYSYRKEFCAQELGDLFLSVGWSSGQYPEKLVIAMKNSDSVACAYDGNRLIGLMNAMSDGVMNVYFHYLLVHPDYQGKGVGKELVAMMLSKYQDFARKILIAYEKETGFYEHCGFTKGEDKVPMFITYLTT